MYKHEKMVTHKEKIASTVSEAAKYSSHQEKKRKVGLKAKKKEEERE